MLKLLIILNFIIGTFGQFDFTDMEPSEILDVVIKAIDIRDGDVDEADVNMYLYTRNNPVVPIQIKHHINYKLKPRKGTKVIIHGYLENGRATYMNRIREEYLKLDDFNVIQVDWKRVGRSYYMSAAKNCRIMGDMIGTAMVDQKLPPSTLHLIGFSLGSHIAGFISKKIKALTGKRVDRISALDPAGPYYRMSSILEDDRLNSKDARIVDALHTDGRFLGYIDPIGTFDLYANKGVRRQPGCQDSEPSLDRRQLLENVLCSHSRAHEYFIQSLIQSNITCNMCNSFYDMETDNCSIHDTVTIVNQNVTEEMTGICAFSTAESEPYF